MITVTEGVLIAIIIQIGLIFRQYLANYLKSKREKLKKIETDKKEEIHKELVLTNINNLANNYMTLSNEVAYLSEKITKIDDYFEYSELCRIFESRLNIFSINLINCSKFDIELRKQFLERLSIRFAKIATNILNCGFNEINYSSVEQLFKGEELYMKVAFKCKDMNLDSHTVSSIVLNEKHMFIFKLKKLIKELNNGDRLEKYKEISEDFILNIVEKIKEIHN